MLTTLAKYVMSVVPETTATSIACALATRTKPLPVQPSEQALMAPATKIFYGADGRNVAWVWGDGPPVVFVHGWGGRAAQMAPLAVHVATLGFRSIALDVTGHGDSPPRHTRWEYFLRDIAALSQSIGADIHAYVGHSAGGLTTMAARGLKGIRARRYVCICAPSHPFPPVRAVQANLNPKPGVMERYKAYIAAQFETTWDRLETGRSYDGAGPDLLLFYDEKDRYINHTEGDRILARCPGARLIKTRNYGHGRILAAPEVAQTVGDFLAAGRHDAEPAQRSAGSTSSRPT